MLNSCRPFFRPCLNRLLSRSLVVGTLTTMSWLSGLTPNLLGASGLPDFGSSAYAQSVSDLDLIRFARAAFAIELKRRAIEQEIKNITGGNVPEIGCYQPEKMATLPNNIRDIVKDFCDFSKQTIRGNGLTIPRFNTIKSNYENDSALKKRVDSELLRIQQNAGS